MRIIVSSIDEAYAYHSELEPVWASLVENCSENRRKTFLAGRVLLQRCLSRYYGCKILPMMKTGPHGKPFFIESRYPFFNISHSAGAIILAVSDFENGVDVEYIKERKNLEGLMERVLGPKEKVFFSTLSKENQLSLFTELWTVREALVKTSGRGLIDESLIEIDPESKELYYYLLPEKLVVETVRMDDLMKSHRDAYLSYVRTDHAQISFELFENSEFTVIENIKTISRFNCINRKF
ncbi:MAG: 4'-phosphopantetheinyl transferase family protein [Succinivibrio sp.]